MAYQDDDGLFGRDWRHKPPMGNLLTSKRQESCIGRLAYANMVRTHERNVSEYAINKMGCMPKGYVIVNAKEVRFNKETALKVTDNRVAIPVKEFAKQRKLTLTEQFDLMDPTWTGTFFGYGGDDPFSYRRPNLKKALTQAMDDDQYDEFMRQFWSPEYENKGAIDRLTRRMNSLQEKAKRLRNRLMEQDRRINKVFSDMKTQHMSWYREQGINVHDYLKILRRERYDWFIEMEEIQAKANRIREYLSDFSF